MKLFLVMGTSLCLATGFANADTTEVNSGNTSEFDSAISFAPQDERIKIKDGWYIAPQIGLGMINNVTYRTLDSTPVNFSFDDSLFYGVGVGVEINNGFRLQFDIATQKNEINLDSTWVWVDTGGAMGLDGDVEVTPLTFSLIWVGAEGESVRPYLGAIIGTTYSDFTVRVTDNGVVRGNYSDDGWELSYGCMVGVLMTLSPSSDLYINYRYLHVDYDSEPLDVQNFSIGINFGF
jgi:opacity protein-like surface antigen